jgi:hypothetical protein
MVMCVFFSLDLNYSSIGLFVKKEKERKKQGKGERGGGGKARMHAYMEWDPIDRAKREQGVH